MSKEFWNERYAENDTGWDLGVVSPPLKAYIDQLEDKTIRILIPGAGNSHEAEYLHQQGFTNVHLVDIAPLAIENFKNRVPDFPENHLHCQDFFELKGSYDLIIEQTFFCAIDPSLRPAYAQHTSNLLQPSGKLVGVLFNEERDSGPPFGGNPTEYTALFEPFYTIAIMEPCYNSIESRKGREVFITLPVIKA